MNKTSHSDEPLEGDGYNQSPNPNSNDLTSNEDFNGLVNSRVVRESDSQPLPNAASNVPGQIVSDAPTENDGRGALEQRVRKMLATFGSFVGPGFMISVAYSMFRILTLRSVSLHLIYMRAPS